MEKKNVLSFGVLLVILSVVGAIIFNMYMGSNDEEKKEIEGTDTVVKEIKYDEIFALGPIFAG